jgi:hypothetical protein
MFNLLHPNFHTHLEQSPLQVYEAAQYLTRYRYTVACYYAAFDTTLPVAYRRCRHYTFYLQVIAENVHIALPHCDCDHLHNLAARRLERPLHQATYKVQPRNQTCSFEYRFQTRRNHGLLREPSPYPIRDEGVRQGHP